MTRSLHDNIRITLNHILAVMENKNNDLTSRSTLLLQAAHYMIMEAQRQINENPLEIAELERQLSETREAYRRQADNDAREIAMLRTQIKDWPGPHESTTGKYGEIVQPICEHEPDTDIAHLTLGLTNSIKRDREGLPERLTVRSRCKLCKTSLLYRLELEQVGGAAVNSLAQSQPCEHGSWYEVSWTEHQGKYVQTNFCDVCHDYFLRLDDLPNPNLRKRAEVLLPQRGEGTK